MATPTGSGWQSIEQKQLELLEGDDWEAFCADLVSFEAYDRHQDPEIQRDSSVSTKDGGRDVLVEIKHQPTKSRLKYQQEFHLRPLTEDNGSVAYSCKAGAHWLSLAIDKDLLKRKEPGRSVEVLLAGGQFRLLINRAGRLDQKVVRGGKKKNKSAAAIPGTTALPVRHLADAFWKKLKELDASAPDPIAQIGIIDVSNILTYLRNRNPTGGAMDAWLEKFKLQNQLTSVEEWERLHVLDRDKPTLVSDPERTRVYQLLGEFFAGRLAERRAWLVGPPGIGKTRLVLEALAAIPNAKQRARIALSHEEAMAAIGDGRLLQRHPNCILIVDDCPVLEASPIASRFLAREGISDDACVLVITPGHVSQNEAKAFPLFWELERLSDASIHSLVEASLSRITHVGDERAETIQRIVTLSAGYPWFAVLISKESDTVKRPPSNPREAAMWALAAKHEATTDNERLELRFRRARALVAATLSTRNDWPSMSPDDRRHLLDAVGIGSWAELQKAAQECVERGILRQSANWKFKYVTPMVLEREVISWFFSENGPDPKGGILACHAERFLPTFQENLNKLGLPSDLLSQFASQTLDAFRKQRFDWDKIRNHALLDTRLSFAAEHLPIETVRELRAWIEATPLDELKRRTRERRPIVFSLERLAARQSSFEDAEASLFRLALAENESYANNATATWASLYSITLNITYRSISQRIELLKQRLADPDGDKRFIALSGLLAILASKGMRIAIDPLDGPRPETSPQEAGQAHQQAIELLASMIDDPSEHVSAAVKKWLIGSLRSSVRRGNGREVARIILAHLDAFAEDERIQTRKALEQIRSYDHPAEDDETVLQQLEHALTPTSFAERLHQQLSGWGPAKDRESLEAKDLSLAREAIEQEPALLSEELGWIYSEKTARSRQFMWALGLVDTARALLPLLKEKARLTSGPTQEKYFLIRYLAGMAGREGENAALAEIESTLAADAESYALGLATMGATTARFKQLVALAAQKKLGHATIQELAHHAQWLSGIEEKDFSDFLHVLYECDKTEYAPIILELILSYVEAKPESAGLLDNWLLQALGVMSATGFRQVDAYQWEQGVMQLLSRDHSTPVVAKLIVDALLSTEGMSQEPWIVFHTLLQKDPGAAWQALSGVLEGSSPEKDGLLLSFRFHPSSFAWPADEVLRWVGKNEQRGRMAVDLVRPYAPELHPILRELLCRFGGRSSVARLIASRVHSTGKVMSNIVQHYAEQLEHARGWLQDAEPEVRVFAKDLVQSLSLSHEVHLAAEQDTKRRWGT
ncbi:MAG: hypothetical protein U0165_03625 [Polyangiaceae bacterium]